MDPTIARTPSACCSICRETSHASSRGPWSPLPFTGFEESLLKMLNSRVTVKLVDSDSSLEIQIPRGRIDARWVMSPGGQSNLLLIRRLLHPATPDFDPIRGRFFAQVFQYGPDHNGRLRAGGDAGGKRRHQSKVVAKFQAVCSFPYLTRIRVRVARQPGSTAQDRPSSEQKNLPPARWGPGFQTDACGYRRGTLFRFEHGSDVTVL
jgi:hypothetical protein